MSFYSKLIFTKITTVSVEELTSSADLPLIKESLGKQIQKLFHGSLAIRVVDAGSPNDCEQELNALSNPVYDCERFGIHFVASPRHADMLMVTGPISRNMVEALKKTYEAIPNPKIVVAVGDGAIDGGIFKGSYAIIDGAHHVIPVHFQIPGDPPSPKRILTSLLFILDRLDKINQQSQ